TGHDQTIQRQPIKRSKQDADRRRGDATPVGRMISWSNRTTEQAEKRQKKNQKRSSKSQVGGLDHWGALDHSVPSIHRSFAEKAKKKVIKISGGGDSTTGGALDHSVT